ncbi:MAG: glycerophosphodiester phosphodiesterase [Hahellaceae bacterium]|nr:glycerophosphodiester phosphodiesterase [Hahellaceae bacterium]MCP5212105.1 glycerophosphodiester phosphodiesterase [Hahellaceae bacterium]
MIIYGHRGAAGEAPENTLSGFQLAYQNGIRNFELDIQLTKDKKLIVIHDTTVDRTTDFKGKVSAFTQAELVAMDARRNVKPWPSKQAIPTLEAILDSCNDFEHFQFEVKSDKKERLSILAKELLNLIYERNIKDRIAVTSSNTWLLKEIKQLDSSVKTGLVAEHRLPNPVTTATKLDCSYLCLNWKLATAELVKAAHASGLIVSTWTVNRIHDVLELEKLGVDSVITDFPNSTLQYFETREAKE